MLIKEDWILLDLKLVIKFGLLKGTSIKKKIKGKGNFQTQ